MRIMRVHEAFWAYGGINLFCSGFGFAKQILYRVFGHFCLILPHMPHVAMVVRQPNHKNMRDMREYEDRVSKGFYLFRIGMRARSRPIYEAGFEKYEAYLHVLPPSPFGHFPQMGKSTQFRGRRPRVT
jgi:hypothetical protein